MFGLVVGVADGLDVFVNYFRRGGGHDFGGGKVGKEARGYGVDALVGALG